MIDITGIVNAVLALIAALITGFVLPWLKAKLTNEQNQILKYWVDVAVKAAEQLLGGGQGEAKKEYVLNWLNSKGFKVDAALIEAAVNENFGKKAEVVASEFDSFPAPNEYAEG